MGTTALGGLATKGALGNFYERLDSIVTVYDKHALKVPSTTKTETLGMAGFVPAPRQFLDSRRVQSMMDFTYSVTNNEYELTLLIPRNEWEDDQTGQIKLRMQELADVWGTYKDSLFATLLAAGNVAGNNDPFGNTFHGDSHTIGTGGVCDNNLTGNYTAGQVTAADALNIIAEARTAFTTYRDDTGRPFAPHAANVMRVIVNGSHERGFWEAVNATLVNSGNSNEWGSAVLQGVDVLPYLSTADELFFSYLGGARRPFIYLERTPLEVVILDGANDVADNNGVKVLCRQRFLLTYGDPRLSQLYVVT